MSINHEFRIRELEKESLAQKNQLEDAGTKLAAAQREIAALTERALAVEAAIEGLKIPATEEPRRGPGRPRKNAEQPQA